MKLDWLKEIQQEELMKLLDRDTKLVYEYCGRDTLIDLLKNLPSVPLYISKRPVERAQKFYIARHFDGNNHKELAAKLDCSLQFVYETLQELKKNRESNDQAEPDLFAPKS